MERDNLNKIYYPIHIKAFEILARFQCRIFEPELGWYNGYFEAYGVEDYLADYYNSDMTVEQLHKNIKNSGEKEIGFSFVFDHDADKNILFDFAKLLSRKGFYY